MAEHPASHTTTKTPEPEPQKELPKNIPRVESKAVAAGTGPDVEDFEGEYVRKSDGETYALAICPGDINGRTHKAMNELHYWEGTLEQFNKEFQEKGSDKQPTDLEKTKKDFEAREKARKEREEQLGKAEDKSAKKKK